MLLHQMLFEGLYYVLIYVTLFISLFWFIIFFERREDLRRKPPMPARIPSVSLIVPAYNEEKGVAKTVRSVLRQKYPREKLRIFVVDDASTDRTAEVAGRFKKDGVVLIRHERNQKKAAALNTALRHVDTELVGYLDADTELSPDSLMNSIAFLEGRTVGVIGNIVPKASKTFSQKIQKVEYAFTSLLRKLLTFLGSLYMTPAFAIYRTDVVRKLGGWDEMNFTEDLDMGMRLQKNGYNVETCLDAHVRTNTPRTIKSFWRQRVRWYRGFIYNSKKHKTMFFGREFSHLGWFVLPIQYIILMLTIPILLFGFYMLVTDIILSLTNYYLVGFDIPFIISKLHFSVSYFHFTLFIISAAALAILLHYGSKQSKQKLNKLEYALYIPIYPIINASLWLSVFFFELTRREYKW